MSFWGELKRRNVYKVGVAYAIVAWLIVQGTAIIAPALQLPQWTLPLVIILLIIGFPLILLFAWAFEITPEGIKRTKEVPLAESITHLTGQKLNYIVTGLLVVAVAFLAFKVYFTDQRTPEPKVVSTETEQVLAVSEEAKAKKAIAVLPFADLSPEKDQEYFADGISEEILNTIAQIPDLNVSGRTSSFSFKDSNKTAQEIAEILGVENILEGSVRKAGNILRITAQLLRAKDGFHLWSKSYDRELKDVADILSIQEDIATAVANELKVTLEIGKSLKQLGSTDSLEAYELYLVAKGQMFDPADTAVMSRALKSIDAAITLDPKFALAWAKKSYIHFYLSIFGPANRASSEQDIALQTAQNAIELEPNLAEGYYSLGHIKAVKGKFIDAESDFRKALELTTEQLSGSESFLGVHYNNVGYFKRSQEIFEEILQNDPLQMEARGCYLLNLWLLGDTAQIEKEYEQGRALFGDQWTWGDVSMIFYYLDAGDIMSSDAITYSDQVFDTAKEHIKSPQEGLKELRQIYADKANLSIVNTAEISLWAAYFGDPNFAMDTMEKAISLDRSTVHMIWFHTWREVRQLPRFKEFVKEIGLVDYWNEFGWPDLCRPLDNSDFECD